MLQSVGSPTGSKTWIGRQLHRRLRAHGVVDLAAEAHQVFITYEFTQLLLGGYLTAAERAHLSTHLR